MFYEKDEVLEWKFLQVWLNLIHDCFSDAFIHPALIAEVQTLNYFFRADRTRAICVEIAECSSKSIASLKDFLVDCAD